MSRLTCSVFVWSIGHADRFTESFCDSCFSFVLLIVTCATLSAGSSGGLSGVAVGVLSEVTAGCLTDERSAVPRGAEPPRVTAARHTDWLSRSCLWDFHWSCALEPNCNLSLYQTNSSWAKFKNLRLNAVCSFWLCVYLLCLIIKIVDYGVFNPETWLTQLCSQLQLSLILTQRKRKNLETPQRSVSYSSLQPLSSSVSHKFWAVLLSCLVDAAVWPQRSVSVWFRFSSELVSICCSDEH